MRWRIAEPQAHAVDADAAQKRRDAEALEGLARGELALEAHLELELVAIEVLARRRLARWTARLVVGVARPARKHVVRVVSTMSVSRRGPACLRPSFHASLKCEGVGDVIDAPAGARLGGPRQLVVAGDALVDVLRALRSARALRPRRSTHSRTPRRRARLFGPWSSAPAQSYRPRAAPSVRWRTSRRGGRAYRGV